MTANTRDFLAAFLDQLRGDGISGSRARMREKPDGVWMAYGGSSLEIFARPWPDGPDADATDGALWPFDCGEVCAGGTQNVRHRAVRRSTVHADHYVWTSEDGGEQTLDLHATVEWEGAWYGLRVFSNSCDFRKDLGRELPDSFSWDRLMAGFTRHAGAPMLGDWDVDERS